MHLPFFPSLTSLLSPLIILLVINSKIVSTATPTSTPSATVPLNPRESDPWPPARPQRPARRRIRGTRIADILIQYPEFYEVIYVDGFHSYIREGFPYTVFFSSAMDIYSVRVMSGDGSARILTEVMVEPENNEVTLRLREKWGPPGWFEVETYRDYERVELEVELYEDDYVEQ